MESAFTDVTHVTLVRTGGDPEARKSAGGRQVPGPAIFIRKVLKGVF